MPKTKTSPGQHRKCLKTTLGLKVVLHTTADLQVSENIQVCGNAAQQTQSQRHHVTICSVLPQHTVTMQLNTLREHKDSQDSNNIYTCKKIQSLILSLVFLTI